MGDQDDIVLAVRKNDAAKVKELLAANPNLILTKTPEGSLLLTAVFSGALKNEPVEPSISRSSPAFAAATVECVAPQSDITNPSKPNSPLSHVSSSVGFSQA